MQRRNGKSESQRIQPTPPQDLRVPKGISCPKCGRWRNTYGDGRPYCAPCSPQVQRIRKELGMEPLTHAEFEGRQRPT